MSANYHIGYAFRADARYFVLAERHRSKDTLGIYDVSDSFKLVRVSLRVSSVFKTDVTEDTRSISHSPQLTCPPLHYLPREIILQCGRAFWRCVM